MNAFLGTARINAFRLGYLPTALSAVRATKVAITMNGTALRVRRGSVQIHDAVNDTPNTCTFDVDPSTVPVTSGRVRVTLGINSPRLLFAGSIQSVELSYEGTSAHRVYRCSAVDDTVRAGRRRPFGTWTNVSATTVAQALVASYAPGFTSTNVAAGLPAVTVSFDGSEGLNGALREIARQIGGYFFWEDLDLYLFQTWSGEQPDTIDSTPGRFLDEPPIASYSDDSQVRTRVYGRGYGDRVMVDVAAGDTVIPIETAARFSATGGSAISDAQVFTYTGTATGDTGSLVGPGVTPSAAPALAQATGSGVNAGAHSYAYTWITASGETLPSPLAAITLAGTAGAPTISSVSSGVLSSGPPAGTTLKYAIVISNGGGLETAPSAVVTITSTGNRPTVSWVITTEMRGNYVNVYRSDDGGTTWSTTTGTGPYASNQTTGVTDTVTDFVTSFTGGGALPTGGTLVLGQVSLTGISVGPSGVTQRKVYRTVAAGSQLKLLTTIANNTATTYTDSTSDASLGANSPTGDTSGLAQPSGQVLPGNTTLTVASTAFASSSGGWAVIGNGRQVVRYTGISGNTLTGIPASGTGSLLAPVNYNSTVTAAPALTGVSGLTSALVAGAPVHIFVQRNDTAAQAALAARDSTDGIIEHLLIDERRELASLTALCDADLGQFSEPLVTVRYATRDVKTRSGRTVTVSLSAPAISETLTIQDVVIDQIDVAPATAPRFTVTASSARFSLYDTLRRMVAGQA